MLDKLESTITVRLPSHEEGLSQDEEYCLLLEGGQERRIRFHDYDQIFAIPGLYETLFSDMLKCSSPEVVASLLVDQVRKSGMQVSELSVLDLGAGNGLVGEAQRRLGVEAIVAVDILEEAAQAAERDRPDVYDRYYVGDVRQLPEETHNDMTARSINCMTCVAALGFGDIPPSAFQAVYDMVEPGGWIAFNIKESFLSGGDENGFAGLIRRMVDDGRLQAHVRQNYRHRLSVSGNWLHYVAIVGRKPAG